MRRDRSETEPGAILGGWDLPAGAGHIGRSVRIKGTVTGNEDLVVDGEVEGVISLTGHHLLVERPGRTSATLRGKNVTLRGRHRGDVEAGDRIEISSGGCMIGDLRAPRVVIQEGARFRGAVDMEVPLPEDLLAAAEARGKRPGDGGKKSRDEGVKDDAGGKKDEGKKKGRSS